MDTKIINDVPNSTVVCILAHGAGAGMDTDFMNYIAEGLSQKGIRVVRFEFPYMTKSREIRKKRAPDTEAKLKSHFLKIIEEETEHDKKRKFFIGGKSMGGRIASIISSEKAHPDISGCICLGYPFHPPGKPENLRTKHLQELDTPCLIIQGTRDPFGKKEEVSTYDIDARIQIAWIEDGEHSFKTTQKSSQTWSEALENAIDHIVGFVAS